MKTSFFLFVLVHKIIGGPKCTPIMEHSVGHHGVPEYVVWRRGHPVQGAVELQLGPGLDKLLRGTLNSGKCF
jgi:hypothetical protein